MPLNTLVFANSLTLAKQLHNGNPISMYSTSLSSVGFLPMYNVSTCTYVCTLGKALMWQSKVGN